MSRLLARKLHYKLKDPARLISHLLSFQRYLDLRSIADRFQFVQCLLPPDGVVESQHMRDWISGDITTACIEACRIKDVSLSPTPHVCGPGSNVAWTDCY